jgi:hypothetical protein
VLNLGFGQNAPLTFKIYRYEPQRKNNTLFNFWYISLYNLYLGLHLI